MMTRLVKEAVADWDYDAISLGFPGPVVRGRPLQEPVNLGKGWVRFDYAGELGRPVRIINDAAMQAMGCYEGGRMLFLGLGTGLGTTLIVDGTVAPLEMGHLPYRRDKSFEDYVGTPSLKHLGRRRWEIIVHDVVARLKAALVADYVVLGGGNVRKLKELPAGCRLGSNRHAFLGGYQLWKKSSRLHIDCATLH
jgi:polyphosphate glucokinase